MEDLEKMSASRIALGHLPELALRREGCTPLHRATAPRTLIWCGKPTPRSWQSVNDRREPSGSPGVRAPGTVRNPPLPDKASINKHRRRRASLGMITLGVTGPMKQRDERAALYGVQVYAPARFLAWGSLSPSTTGAL